MKKIYFLVLTFCFFNGLNAQIIDFPDANFKNQLLAANENTIMIAEDEFGNNIKIDSNNDGEIDVNEASRVVALWAGSTSISSIEGISYFYNLTYLSCSFSSISSLELSSLAKLEELYCNDNQLTSLDVRALKNLKTLYVSNNQITALNFDGLINLEFLMFDGNKIKSLDISGFPNLIGLACGRNELTSIKVGSLKELLFLYCSDNLLTTLDLRGLPKLDSFDCDNNQLLTSLFMKNGINERYLTFKNSPNLGNICVDESQFTEVQNLVNQYNYTNCQINSNCSSKPGEIGLGTQDFAFSDYFTIYPNPANEVLNVSSKSKIEIHSIAVYDILGQLVIVLPNIKDTSKIDVSNLSSGNYFLKVKSDKGSSSVKFIKN